MFELHQDALNYFRAQQPAENDNDHRHRKRAALKRTAPSDIRLVWGPDVFDSLVELDVDLKSSCEFVKAGLLCERPRTFVHA